MPPHLRGDKDAPTSGLAEHIYLGLDAFTADVCPTLTPSDLVILVWVAEAERGAAGSPALEEAMAALSCAAGAGAGVAHAVVVPARGSSPASSFSSASLPSTPRLLALQLQAAGGVGGAGGSSSGAGQGAGAAPGSRDSVGSRSTTESLQLGGLSGGDAGSSSSSTFCSAIVGRIRSIAPHGVVVALPSLQLGWDLRCTLPLSVAASVAAAMAPSVSLSPSFLGELVLKLVLNAVTTGAHIARGTIFTNRMVNVSITNQKLFHRAVGIVADVTGVPTPTAKRAVLRAIYGLDEDTNGGGGPAGASVSLDAMAAEGTTGGHVVAAATQTQLVPVAILLALDGALDGPAAAAAYGGGGGGAAKLGRQTSSTASPSSITPVGGRGEGGGSSSSPASATGPKRSSSSRGVGGPVGASAVTSSATARPSSGGGGSSPSQPSRPRFPLYSSSTHTSASSKSGGGGGGGGRGPLSVAAAIEILTVEPVIRKALLLARGGGGDRRS